MAGRETDLAGHGATDSLALRPLAESDLPAAQALSAAVGWPHRVEDWRFVHGLGSGVALEQGGALVGTALTWRYGAEAAALGMVIVAPEHQGKGFGRRLLAAALEELGDGRRVLLHATEAGLPLYHGLGFRARGMVRQQQGAAFSVGLVAPRPGERIRPVGRSDAPALAALDAEAAGMERGPVIAALLEVAEGVVLDRGGEAAGFALLRRFGRGHVIGPVVAPDAEAAKALIGHWLGSRSGQFLRIDVPDEAGLCPWLAGLGLSEVDKAVPMLRGEAPAPGGRARAFALVNQALG
jgi:GNAT superfamily N-acetyltransferase